MVHPAVYAIIAFAGVAAISYKIYEDYQEAKMYEQYQRHRTRYEQERQQYNHFERRNKEFDDSDDEDTLRRRRPFKKRSQNGTSSTEQSQYELTDLETSISERKRKLMAEQAFLDQEEENLRNRKQALMRGFDDDVTQHSSRFISSNSSSDNEDDQSLKDHMALFSRPHQESAENTSDSTETIHRENDRPLHNSTELYYPAASLTPTTSTANSVVSHTNRISDSEESWDAVSERGWNQSSANESDNELDSHHSITSFSDNENRIRF
ncbi:uncharacterized protein EV154DRAFT_511953 [Mucor mucedo]|uniref:uncharacterized protein n=1 Tax=Mucor mucedo TaxID=29922 RepID=UPI00221EC39F|nr:uncharacterized protein EV154DRAFT_511953 [Mucor mucedo]KAI7890236.1 hypothetical protein EV154DRAFT_511953 [Mucor mucedo]